MKQTPTTLSVPAPAKLNLFLHITNQRSDGYHELQTIFQFIDLSDTLEFTLTDTDEIRVTQQNAHSTSEIIEEKDNLIYKAATALLPYRQAPQGIRIKYEKRIPSGAGLGGGSSDAATTLLVLNELWQCQQSLEQLRAIGLKLGADVPVFVNGTAAFAEGVGEHLTPVSPNTPWYVVIKPNAHISTAEIFSHPDLTRNTPTLKISAALEHGGHNDCENVVRALYSEVDQALKWLAKFSPSKLTGTGACVFAEFPTESEALAVAQQYADSTAIFVAKGMNDNPAHRVLQELTF
ncbi:4-(cytidine 5'-diphospho)-2-C-methyl-D-erythritol kinase [Litoribrevibacter albus]|uniref:4-diphosphocytidyl-2-C-methyl-D-erythritol kinase n=1 Tax=Litoribrevibacter albus TaxID=1473156 RepID=A0AA37SBV1_9GAMM|nr:4-(cytidine 5'-diphospho)-2-C-methyl-D-erythritol kinase [Litoribrevibacter albus]GLQ32469.1 4-diphosphocytidyl-2-C-methyl-D-erythritol kinase [Litoribrevibacter albus]